MMSSYRGGDTLSVRLRALRKYHTNQKHIWDIGCDHGLLGLSFAQDKTLSIHLVDPSKPVIETLLNKLKDSYITNRNLLVTQSRGQDLNIKSSSNTIFIAGMGGKEVGQIVTTLLSQLDSTSQFVISPHRKILELRSLLHSLPLTLLREEVLLQDNQYYQILALRPGEGEGVSLYGEELWQGKIGKRYLDHQLEHFTPHQDQISQQYVSYLKNLKSNK